MTRAADNERLAGDLQQHLVDLGEDLSIDRWAGPRTRAAAKRLLGLPWTAPRATPPVLPGQWPARDEASLSAYYGPPGSGRQTYIRLPYPMRLAWDPDTRVHRAQCHELVAPSLAGVLEAIRDNYGYDGLVDAGLDLFGGIYNLRPMRDRSSAWSTHAWGIAIDLDPLHNGLKTPWPSKARMPERVIEIFEAAGWTSLARVIGRDAMHFQATTWGA